MVSFVRIPFPYFSGVILSIKVLLLFIPNKTLIGAIDRCISGSHFSFMRRSVASIAVVVGAATLSFYTTVSDAPVEKIAGALLPFHPSGSRAPRQEGDCKTIIADTVAYLKNEKVTLSEKKMRAIARHVYDESLRCHIDYRLILALMKVESNFKNNAVSSKGARGLLQIKPSLGRTVAKDIGMKWKGKSQLHDPDKNIRIGVHHLSCLIQDFSTLPSALHAYNGGARRAKAMAARKEHPTVRFASAVMKEYSKTLSLLPDPTGG